MVRNWLKVFHRQRERLERCPVNVDLVDASGIYRSNGIADAMLANAFGKHLSHFREQQLGIAQTANSIVRFENHCSRNNRTKECPATDFIDASYKLGAIRPGELLIPQSAFQFFSSRRFRVDIHRFFSSGLGSLKY